MTDKEKLERVKLLSRKIYEYSLEISVILGNIHKKILKGNPESVIRIVEDVFKINISTRRDNGKLSRNFKIAEVRHVARYLLNRYGILNNTEIALYTGGTEHSIVSWSVKRVIGLMETDESFKEKVKECIRKIEIIQ